MSTITALSQLDPNRPYSYADYLTWEFGEWVELLGGQYSVFSSPGKSPTHQQVVSRIGMQVAERWNDPAYETWSLPFPLILGYEELENSYNLVLPDVYVMGKHPPNYLDDRGWHGVPAWIVEVTDARTEETDRTAKFNLYQYFGVREYWIVSPDKRQVVQYVLDSNGRYQLLAEKSNSGLAHVQVLSGLEIDWDEVFA
ncbi:Uma2 family endonuclease [Larkinella knui]|uniref:Uma2 family endonuclease n=1 Tax=Larkinella knui TaxID=2025310 RepID=A0A3P1CYD5_9BACT|nr:Uma2 family endonuclease [Larkinella knui]RRB18178.1 Uma2 family endonuclease [Larkinella knui]